MRQETGTFSKQVMGENVLKNMCSVANYLLAQICFHKMWRGGAKIKWLGVAVALMRCRENVT